MKRSRSYVIPHVHKVRSHLNHILNGAVDDDEAELFERSVIKREGCGVSGWVSMGAAVH